jgi:hypothetical protein
VEARAGIFTPTYYRPCILGHTTQQKLLTFTYHKLKGFFSHVHLAGSSAYFSKLSLRQKIIFDDKYSLPSYLVDFD